MRVYAGVLEDERHRSNALIEIELGRLQESADANASTEQ
jgi:hypothetical protein